MISWDGRSRMPYRFQRQMKILPGIALNFNRKSMSASFGQRGAHITVGPKGARSTIGLPGMGLSYTKYQRGRLGIFLNCDGNLLETLNNHGTCASGLRARPT